MVSVLAVAPGSPGGHFVLNLPYDLQGMEDPGLGSAGRLGFVGGVQVVICAGSRTGQWGSITASGVPLRRRKDWKPDAQSAYQVI